MKKRLLITALSGLIPAFSFAQATMYFSDQTALFPSTTYSSGNSIGVCDMNNDGKDDVVRSENITMSVVYQGASNGAFTEGTYTYPLSSPWGMCVADVDNDGYNDVMWGDNGASRLMQWNGSGYTGSNISTTTGAGSIFVQGCNFADVNNDHFPDMFVCNDVDMPHIYVNNGGTGWTFDQSLMPLATVPASDNSGNYASIWTDVNNDGLIDLFITHCRQGVNNSSDARRIDQVFINNGNGTYTQDVTNWTNLRDGAQGWSTAWGDIDNDGDMDCFVCNYGVNSTLMQNDGTGVFTDIMASSGIPNTTNFFGENATFQDFDNDGFLDLFVTGDEHYVMKGNGNGTFAAVTNPYVYGTNDIRAHAIGDLNNDGWLDVYASYCSLYNTPSTSRRDKVWMNTEFSNGNTNHWIKFNLVGGAVNGFSTKNALGAIIKIYGPWGVQVREVRSGEGYGIQNSFTMHFGLGQNTGVDSVTVNWPSGIVDHMLGLGGDVTYTVNEGQSPLAAGTTIANPLSISLSPNPALHADVTIALNNFAQYGLTNLTVNIYDITGKLVYSEAKMNQCIISVSSELFTSGMYFVEVRNKDKRLASEKLLVQ
jgi:ASPIC and UnbV/FG-GAP-like repeat/Secretion system C-terminal sorting domain